MCCWTMAKSKTNFYTICVNDVETFCDNGMILGVYDYRTRRFTQIVCRLKEAQKVPFQEWRSSKEDLLI